MRTRPFYAKEPLHTRKNPIRAKEPTNMQTMYHRQWLHRNLLRPCSQIPYLRRRAEKYARKPYTCRRAHPYVVNPHTNAKEPFSGQRDCKDRVTETHRMHAIKVISRKRATNHRLHLRKMTYKDKAFYGLRHTLRK